MLRQERGEAREVSKNIGKIVASSVADALFLSGAANERFEEAAKKKILWKREREIY